MPDFLTEEASSSWLSHERHAEIGSMHKLRILILYPDPAGLALLTSMLKSLGHAIEEATTDRAAVRSMERNDIDLVLAGVDPLDAEALELLMYVRRKHREVPVILLFPRLHPERAKEALRLGAMAVLKYPVPAAELRAAVLQALERCETRHTDPAPANPVAPAATASRAPAAQASAIELSPIAPHSAVPAPQNSRLAAPAPLAVSANPPSFAPAHRVEQQAREIGMVGNDPSWRQVIDLAVTIAATRSSVLIVGEPGTGKSLLAQLIHSLGSSPDRPFVTVEGSTMADEHSMQQPREPAPAATNHSLDWSNKMASASGGTLFLHDVAALPLELQLHLLRDLQFRDYEASSGHAATNSEARLIMSTSENLSSLIDQGRFRQELYHRISVISLMLPPLRHRGTDVELLAESFRNHYSREFHKSVAGFTRDALEVLQKHDWPGNIRELAAAIQRAVALCNGPRITSNHLAPILNHNRHSRSGGSTTPRPHLKMGVRPLKEALEEPEKRIIIQALQAFNWNRQETARVLDINRTTLYKKMKKYNLIDETVWVN
jgi:two-component system response regulator HydG